MALTSDKFYMINIKNYQPRNFQGSNHSVWNKLPVSRRSSVFVLLFVGNLGELRVVLTKRSSKLRNFPGHISFPGGKADNGLESYWEVARREMEEEIGISADNTYLQKEYNVTIDHITTLPCYLSRTFSAVKPCIGFLNFQTKSSDVTKKIQMQLNPGESSSAFSCPLKDFLFPTVNDPPIESLDRSYYKVEWGKIPWNLRSYTFSQNIINEPEWLKSLQNFSESEESDDSGLEAESEEESERKKRKELKQSKKNKLSEWGRLGSRRDSETNEKIYDVWGLTANILHDLAELVYIGPDKIIRELGEEELIYSLWSEGGQLREKERSAQESQLIKATTKHDIGFNDVLPRTEFNRLSKLYSIE